MQKPMRILLVTQHFPPEKGAVRRLFEFSLYFQKKGHDVSILTAMPNYPDGIVPPKYKGKLFVREIISGLKVYRSYVLPASNAKPGKRMIGFITFLFSSLINSFRIKGNFDLVLASSPPVTSPLIGFILSRLRKTKFILEIRDIQPESGEQFGNLKKSIFTEMIRKVMRFLYRRADHIVCATEGIEEWMRGIGIPSSRLATVKSGVGRDFIDSHSNGIRKKFGWEDKFLILFSGTLGWVRPLETIVESARLLADDKRYHFVFVGDGQKKKSLQTLASRYNLKNVSFVGLQPLEEIPFFLKAGDVLVECLKEVPVARVALPTKIFEYMAAGKPIIFGAPDGETKRMLEKAGGALCFSNSDPAQLADMIQALHNRKIDGEELGRKYREFVTKGHTREIWAEKYLDIIEKSKIS
jgi:glycosyltransferase involved in cell wall biosynthesis